MLDSWLCMRLFASLAAKQRVAASRAAVEGKLLALAEQWPDAGAQGGEGTLDCGHRSGVIGQMFQLSIEDMQFSLAQQILQR